MYRFIPAVFFLFLCLMFLLSPAVWAEPKVSVKTEYYDIEGANERALRKEMDRKGKRKTGHPFHAYTSWYVNWKYVFAGPRHLCKIASVRTDLEIIYQLPRWTDQSSASESLKKKWASYMEALQIHEKGHADLGMEAARLVEARLLDSPPVPGCNEAVFNRIADQAVDEIRAKEEAYDRQTRHGKTQGAVFS